MSAIHLIQLLCTSTSTLQKTLHPSIFSKELWEQHAIAGEVRFLMLTISHQHKEIGTTTHLLAHRVIQESVAVVLVLYHLAEHADSWTDTDRAEMSTPAPLLINVIYSAFYTSPQTAIQMGLFQNVASKSTIINAWGLSVVYFARNRLIGQYKLT